MDAAARVAAAGDLGNDPVTDSTTTAVLEPKALKRGGGQREKKTSYGKTAKVGALWAVGRESVTQLLGIPAALLLARLLSPADFGIDFLELASLWPRPALDFALRADPVVLHSTPGETGRCSSGG